MMKSAVKMSLKCSSKCLGGWSLSLILVILFNVTPSVEMWGVEDDGMLFEHDPCVLKTGKNGICTRIKSCTVYMDALNSETMAYADIVRCTFDDDFTEIICCPHPEGSEVKIPNKIAENKNEVEEDVDKEEVDKEEVDKEEVDKEEVDKEEVEKEEVDKEEVEKEKFEEEEYEYDDEEKEFILSKNIKVPSLPRKDPVEKQRPSEIACERYEAITHTDDVKYPHSAALVFDSMNGPLIVCGASLISEHFIITAAHCLNDTYRDALTVIFGVTLLNPIDAAISVQIEEQHIHPKYRQGSKYHDIALLQLKENNLISSRIKPACLYANVEDIDSTTELTESFWAYVDENRVLSEKIVTTVPLRECNETYLAAGVQRAYAYGIDAGQYCANDDPEFQGEFGGPLQLLDGRNSIIVGIASQAISEETSVYVRVAYYLNWIENTVWASK